MRRSIGGMTVAWLLATAATCHADANAVLELRPPPADAIDGALLNRSVRGALAAGVDYLLDRSTNDLNLAWEPVHTRQLVGYKSNSTYTVRYKQVTVKEPIYKHEHTYEDYEVLTVVRQGESLNASRKLQKVKKRRVVGTKSTKVGERNVTRTVADPNGPIVRTHTRNHGPIYDAGGDIWHDGFLGVNAMVLHALLTCGVPQTNEIVTGMATTLKHYVGGFGAPDRTFDLAWLTAAFVQLEGKAYTNTAHHLVHRLLGGQIREGPGRGLWGPTCINAELLSALVEYEQTLNDEIAKRAATLRKKPDSKPRQRRLKEAKEFLKEYQKLYRRASTQGLRFEQVRSRYSQKISDDYMMEIGWAMDPPPPVSRPGMPFYIYNQTIGDLEQTALALYAIGQAAAAGKLPETTEPPRVDGVLPLLPEEKTSALLARAAAAISRRQSSRGQWDEGNVHQPLAAFGPLGFEPIPIHDAHDLDSARRPMTTAQAYTALIDAGQTVGLTKLLGKFQTQVGRGRHVALAELTDYLDKDIADPTLAATFGRLVSPYDYLFSVRGIQRRYGGEVEERRDVWKRIAYQLLDLQEEIGNWGAIGKVVTIPSSQLEWIVQEKRKAHEKAMKTKIPAERKPFDRKVASRHRDLGPYAFTDSTLVKTAYAMLCLADGVRPPAVGVWPWEKGSRPPPTLAAVLRKSEPQSGHALTYQALGPELSAGDLSGLPAVYMTGSGSRVPLAGKTAAAVKAYIEGGGLVVVETLENPDGAAFRQAVRVELESLLPGTRLGNLRGDHAFMKPVQNNPPAVQALFRGDGSVAAVFLPISPTGASAGTRLSTRHAGAISMEILRNRLDPDLERPDYPIRIAGADIRAERIRARNALRLRAEEYMFPAVVIEEAADTPAKTPATPTIGAADATAPTRPPAAVTRPAGEFPPPTVRRAKPRQADDDW